MGHMRRMIPMFNSVGRSVGLVHAILELWAEITRSSQLVKAIDDRVRDEAAPVELDMLSWMGRTALELIGQAGLGYSFDPLIADAPDEFAEAAKAFM